MTFKRRSEAPRLKGGASDRQALRAKKEEEELKTAECQTENRT